MRKIFSIKKLFFEKLTLKNDWIFNETKLESLMLQKICANFELQTHFPAPQNTVVSIFEVYVSI